MAGGVGGRKIFFGAVVAGVPSSILTAPRPPSVLSRDPPIPPSAPAPSDRLGAQDSSAADPSSAITVQSVPILDVGG